MMNLGNSLRQEMADAIALRVCVCSYVYWFSVGCCFFPCRGFPSTYHQKRVIRPTFLFMVSVWHIVDNDEVVSKNRKGIFTFHETSDYLLECGMQDAFRKYQAAQLLQRAEKLFIENGRYKDLEVRTGVNLNHKRACVDIYLRLNNNLDAGVQIEHDQFRVIFQGKTVEKLFDKKTGELSEKPYNFLDEIWNEYLNNCHDVKIKRNYCKYGTGFVYRYVRIPEDTEKLLLLEDGGWFTRCPELSVKYILDKIIARKDDIIEGLSK